MNNKIKALNSITAPGADASDITGKTYGSRRGLDVAILGGDHLQGIVPLLMGTMPEINWNKIIETINTDTDYDYAFYYDSNLQFTVNVSYASDGARTISVTSYSHMLFEDGGAMLAEDGTQFLFEG